MQLALPLVKTHGFTREALSNSVLHLPTPHAQPLSETATSALFGNGDDARRTLIHAWLDDARQKMHTEPNSSASMKTILGTRLAQNVPVLHHLPEACISFSSFYHCFNLSSTDFQAYALLLTDSSGIPPLNPEPLLQHAAKIADEACSVAGEMSPGVSLYLRTIHAIITNCY